VSVRPFDFGALDISVDFLQKYNNFRNIAIISIKTHQPRPEGVKHKSATRGSRTLWMPQNKKM